MLCIKCQSLTRVLETREGTKRTRACPQGHRFQTVEQAVGGVFRPIVKQAKRPPAAHQIAQ